MLSPLQKKTAQALVVLFETGDPRGDYSALTVIPGDTGHLSYGRLQVTLGSGNLSALVARYCRQPRAALADELRPYLDRLRARDVSLDTDEGLKALLRDAADDPAMRAVQDQYVDDVFWAPSTLASTSEVLVTAVGASVVFDGFVHGAWAAMRDRTDQRAGKAKDIGEHAWIAHYVAVRRAWLAAHERADLRECVYRMDAYRDIIAAGNWQLALPMTVRGRVLDISALLTGIRTLALQTPHMRGDDVRRVQKALTRFGLAVAPDGEFGPATAAAIREFQTARGLMVDGVAGLRTFAALGID